MHNRLRVNDRTFNNRFRRDSDAFLVIVWLWEFTCKVVRVRMRCKSK